MYNRIEKIMSATSSAHGLGTSTNSDNQNMYQLVAGETVFAD